MRSGHYVGILEGFMRFIKQSLHYNVRDGSIISDTVCSSQLESTDPFLRLVVVWHNNILGHPSRVLDPDPLPRVTFAGALLLHQNLPTWRRQVAQI